MTQSGITGDPLATRGEGRGAESRSDGIIQVSTGGAAFASGSAVKDMLLGAVSIAEHVHRVAGRYPR
jgi:fructose/tagatose bisphosphate aldolase